MAPQTSDPVARLERHLVEEFVTDYITQAMGRRTAVKIDPAQLFMAMRFAA